uniref:Uncharacterized protein n=1 Tax=Utricularia reniformis TaxID=192314 RepID=A0A1Y0B100_9LAMI|nr:hypothetical protein AEK19_MT0817 [Utricularia reniformis]YP_009382321.1 hypothetical protein AEK19_MT1893 [Utricularia reniformis]ART31051.1 hypothetical protein AEK19_MT0817 [Utricularia reniformis]ART32061.1 hypothetical protein AEK19_MT1893 [Utricularia reniformis]
MITALKELAILIAGVIYLIGSGTILVRVNQRQRRALLHCLLVAKVRGISKPFNN